MSTKDNKQNSMSKPEIVNAGNTEYQEIGPQQPKKFNQERLNVFTQKKEEYQPKGFKPDWDENKTAAKTIESTTQKTSTAHEEVKTDPKKFNPDIIAVFQGSKAERHESGSSIKQQHKIKETEQHKLERESKSNYTQIH